MTATTILANTFFAFFYVLGEHFIGVIAVAIFFSLIMAFYYLLIKRQGLTGPGEKIKIKLKVGVLLLNFNHLSVLPLLTLFSLPEGIIASTTAYIGDVFTDAFLLIALAIGLPLAFWFIRAVMRLMPKAK